MDTSKHRNFIFADESNTDKARFMLIGGIWVDEVTYIQVIEECKQFKISNGWQEKPSLTGKVYQRKPSTNIANL